MYVKLTAEQIIEFHDEELSHGIGLTGIKDRGHLELIAEKPFTEYFGEEQYPGLLLKAAVVATFAFLFLNKQMLDASDNDVFQTTIKVAQNKMDISKLSVWIQKNCVSI